MSEKRLWTDSFGDVALQQISESTLSVKVRTGVFGHGEWAEQCLLNNDLPALRDALSEWLGGEKEVNLQDLSPEEREEAVGHMTPHGLAVALSEVASNDTTWLRVVETILEQRVDKEVANAVRQMIAGLL